LATRYSPRLIVVVAFATVCAACSGGGSNSGIAGSGGTTSGGAGVTPQAGSGGALGGAANASGGNAGAGPAVGGGAGGALASGGVGGTGAAGASGSGGQADAGGSGGSAGTKPTNVWTGTWAAAPQGCDGSFNQRTLRQIVHTSIGGTSARVRISNVYSGGAVQITDVHVAQRTNGSSIDPATDQALTFAGKADVTVAPGMFAVSDGAAFTVKPLSDVAVTFYVVSNNGTTCHLSGFQTNYSVSGNMASSATLPGAQTNDRYNFLSNLDVLNPDAEGAVVTLGASITDGYKAPGDANRRWPNDLAVRLDMAKRVIGVLNEGISADGVKNAVARFDRDVLSQANVKWVIFSDNAINDLGGFKPPAQTEIDQMKTMMGKAHAKGVKFLCSTLTPFEPAEPGRSAINAFIRTPDSGCDGIVDQDTATHDPAAPTKWLAAFNSGDSLHPNTPGLQAIADAVNFDLFK
jgi:lysophospholipase L1-like esterase